MIGDKPDALRLSDALRESHPYPMHIRLAADELVWLFEARERDRVAFKQVLAQRDALLEALRWIAAVNATDREYQAKARAAIAAVEEGEKP